LEAKGNKNRKGMKGDRPLELHEAEAIGGSKRPERLGLKRVKKGGEKTTTGVGGGEVEGKPFGSRGRWKEEKKNGRE